MSEKFNSEPGDYIQAEFILHMLVFISGLAAEDRFDELLKIGLRRDQIDALLEMSAHEVYAAANRSQALFFNIQVDDEALDASLNIAKRQVDEYRKVDRLIMAEARYPTLNRLYGLDRETLVKRRKKLGLTGRVNGRPSAPTLEQKLNIIEQLEQMKSSQSSETDILLNLSDTHQITVDSVWPIYQEWSGGMEVMNSTGGVASAVGH